MGITQDCMPGMVQSIPGAFVCYPRERIRRGMSPRLCKGVFDGRSIFCRCNVGITHYGADRHSVFCPRRSGILNPDAIEATLTRRLRAICYSSCSFFGFLAIQKGESGIEVLSSVGLYLCPCDSFCPVCLWSTPTITSTRFGCTANTTN